MSKSQWNSIVVHFSKLPDPRVARSQRHPLINLLVIGVCAVICGADSFTAMEEFGKRRRKWLERFLDLENGIPSHDRFNNVFARLQPEQFEQCLLNWITALHQVSDGQILAVDGKTLRGSYGRGDAKAAIHMVSVWATANHLSLGSRVVDDKSNEITAIPRLLELIEIQGALVTIDAMGCQKEIARTIRRQRADYVLAVKDNQPTLHEAVVSFLGRHLEEDFANWPVRTVRTKQRGHGREDERWYYVTPIPDDFPGRSQWPDLKAVGMVVRVSRQGERTSDETRFYILSRYLSGRRFAEAVRGHWGIENNLHWQLDVTFREDDLRIRNGHAPANMSILMRTALSLLKNESSGKRSIRTKRLAAAWDERYLEKVLTGS